MTTKNIRILLVLMLLTIGGLFVTQSYWFQKSFDLEERQFDEQMNLALRKVGDRILIYNQDSTSKIPPVSKISSTEYLVKPNVYFPLNVLDSILKKEFKKEKISVDYSYSILIAEEGVITLGNRVYVIADSNVVACKKREDGKENLNFIVRVHGKSTYLVGSMGIWLFSSFSLLVVLGVFTFILISIFRGKKLANLKKDFVNNMTHELKTPIANIAVASDVLKTRNKEMDSKKLTKYAEIISNENERLHVLVNQVLQLSSEENKEEFFDLKDVDIHAVINNVSQSYELQIAKRKGKITHQLKAEKQTIKGDKFHLTNALSNLVDNAIKFSENKLEVLIKTTNTANGIVIEVSDKGRGIPKQDLAFIFDKFYRSETGNIHTTKGYGLGLSYVQLIVKKHNGSISVVSNKNQGSTFSLFVPF